MDAFVRYRCQRRRLFPYFVGAGLVIGPTCFTKIADPTLNDVILTNSPNNCMNVLNFNCGISDVHNLISVQIKVI